MRTPIEAYLVVAGLFLLTALILGIYTLLTMRDDD